MLAEIEKLTNFASSNDFLLFYFILFYKQDPKLGITEITKNLLFCLVNLFLREFTKRRTTLCILRGGKEGV